MPTFVLLVLLFVASLLRLYQLGKENLWIDEATSVGIAKNSLAQVLRLSLDDHNPPLHYLLLHYWIWLFGDSELSVRMPSVLFGIFSVAMLYKLGTTLFNKWTGLMSAFILAISAYQLNYSQEARAYSMMVFLTLVSFYFLLKLFEGKDYRVLIGYVLSTTALLYSHYYGLFFTIAQVLYILGVYSTKEYREKAPLFRTWVIAGGAIAALCLPGFFYLAYSLTHSQTYNWLRRPDLKVLSTSFVNYTGAPGIASSIKLFLLLTLFACASIALIGRIRGEEAKLHLLSLWLVVPILLPFVLSQVSTPIYFHRYCIAALPALYLLAAEGTWRASGLAAEGMHRANSILRRTPTRKPVLLAALGIMGSFALVACVLSWPILQEYFTTVKKEPWKKVASYVQTHTQPGDLLVSTKAGFYAYDYYARSAEVLSPVEQPRIEREEEVGRAAGSSGRAWLILAHLSTDRQIQYKAAFAKAKFVEVDHKHFQAADGSIDLLLYKKQ